MAYRLSQDQITVLQRVFSLKYGLESFRAKVLKAANLVMAAKALLEESAFSREQKLRSVDYLRPSEKDADATDIAPLACLKLGDDEASWETLSNALQLLIKAKKRIASNAQYAQQQKADLEAAIEILTTAFVPMDPRDIDGFQVSDEEIINFLTADKVLKLAASFVQPHKKEAQVAMLASVRRLAQDHNYLPYISLEVFDYVLNVVRVSAGLRTDYVITDDWYFRMLLQEFQQKEKPTGMRDDDLINIVVFFKPLYRLILTWFQRIAELEALPNINQAMISHYRRAFEDWLKQQLAVALLQDTSFENFSRDLDALAGQPFDDDALRLTCERTVSSFFNCPDYCGVAEKAVVGPACTEMMTSVPDYASDIARAGENVGALLVRCPDDPFFKAMEGVVDAFDAEVCTFSDNRDQGSEDIQQYLSTCSQHVFYGVDVKKSLSVSPLVKPSFSIARQQYDALQNSPVHQDYRALQQRAEALRQCSVSQGERCLSLLPAAKRLAGYQSFMLAPDYFFAPDVRFKVRDDMQRAVHFAQYMKSKNPVSRFFTRLGFAFRRLFGMNLDKPVDRAITAVSNPIQFGTQGEASRRLQAIDDQFVQLLGQASTDVTTSRASTSGQTTPRSQAGLSFDSSRRYASGRDASVVIEDSFGMASDGASISGSGGSFRTSSPVSSGSVSYRSSTGGIAEQLEAASVRGQGQKGVSRCLFDKQEPGNANWRRTCGRPADNRPPAYQLAKKEEVVGGGLASTCYRAAVR